MIDEQEDLEWQHDRFRDEQTIDDFLKAERKLAEGENNVY